MFFPGRWVTAGAWAAFTLNLSKWRRQAIVSKRPLCVLVTRVHLPDCWVKSRQSAARRPGVVNYFVWC